MDILRSLEAMRGWRGNVRHDRRVGFAPTMGNLHAGHLSLVEAAQGQSDLVVASIFINPMQFGADEDLAAYPRTIDADLEKLERAGAAAVFIPRISDIYPDGVDQHTSVIVPGLTDVLCGASRPNHFRGVTTVVAKLLGIVRADIAVLGAKDLQQVLVIKKMVRDLVMGTEIVTVPTQREPSGLAMSSRNGYLSEDEYRLAPTFSRVLNTCSAALARPHVDVAATLAHAQAELIDAGFRIDYLEARRTYDLALTAELVDEIAVFGAVYLGNTRLIDNRIVSIS